MVTARLARYCVLLRWLVALLLSGTLLMSGTLALAVAPAASAVTGAMSAPFVPLPNSSTASTGSQPQQLESENWSGYVVASWETNRQYFAASGEWVVPAVSLAPGSKRMYSGSWVGIGGFCTTSKCTKTYSDLIQLGTEQDVTRAGATYNAWYEMLPGAEMEITSLVIHPGDLIRAALQGVPLAGMSRNKKLQPMEWWLNLSDLTTGQSWSTVVSYKSSLASAEWIEEAPTVGNKIGALANYGLESFDPISADGVDPYLMPSQSIIMVDPHGQTSNPSIPNLSQNGFNTCWGNDNTLTTCPAPAD